MTALLPDDSYCTNDLGRLVFQPKSDWSGRCYVSEAKETSQMGVKFVEYTCVIVMSPKQSLGLDDRTFVLPTRFKFLSKLHGALKKLHSQLYLKSPFPPFPEAKWIGGNDAQTIADRKNGTETLITFILNQEVLRKSRIFHQFLETAEEKVPEGAIIDVGSTLTVGNGLLDSHFIIPSEVVPVITPENLSRPSSSHSFHFDDVAIEDSIVMANQGRRFFSDYLAKFTKKNETEDYLVVAGRLVSTAQLAETEGAYEAAFYSYKEAATVLIKGMESEKSLSNRNAVRLKSAKFIEKAEQIYRNHLRYDNGPLFDMRNIPRDKEESMAFRSSNSALKSFRFIGVLPDVEAKKRVFLVQEIETEGLFVMKLVERRDESSEGIFLPTAVPHMVSLLKFFTTTHFIILLLPYVNTGRLWSFLCRYLADSERWYEEEERKEANVDFVETDEADKENPYRGRHTRFSVTADCERLAVMENEGLEESSSSAVICSVGEDVMGDEREGREGGERYLLLPSDTVERNTMVVEEESPAPLALTLIEVEKRGEKGKEKKEEKEGTSLSEAMAECRDCLKMSKRCWMGPIPESLIVHWSAQCVSLLYVLHSHQVYIGDLHPDNLLIDEEGNVQFTYQTRWNNDTKERLFMAGYAAPETSSIGSSITPACDVWSLGALMYELFVGRPLSSAAPHGISYQSELPLLSEVAHMSFAARDLISRILQIDPEERITIDQIRAHPLYSSIDWLLYDNPHGPVREGPKSGENREKTEMEKRREIEDERDRLEREKAESRRQMMEIEEEEREAREELARLTALLETGEEEEEEIEDPLPEVPGRM